jgi:RHS repeat-associated protein
MTRHPATGAVERRAAHPLGLTTYYFGFYRSFSGGNNRVDGYSYDASGNLLNDGNHSYTYDAENRITQVDGGSTAYVYDAFGHRVRRGTLDYIYDAAGHAVAVVSGCQTCWYRGEVFAGSRHLATYANSTTYFAHSDWLGTERVRTDVNGSVFETCQGLPYGDGLNCSGTDFSPLHFTGKERDPESNLDNFGARYYTSTMGRWMTPDWSARGDAVPYATLTDPQSLNLYVYVRDNPNTLTDPDGHAAWPGEIASFFHDLACSLTNSCNSQSSQVAANQTDDPQTQQQNMSLSQKGLAFIERHEGYGGTVYKDSAGNPTIGYGHLIKNGEDFTKGITKDQASTLLAEDVKGAVGAVNADLKVAVSQAKFDALVDFTYNLGGKNLANSTLLSNINAGKPVAGSNFTSYNQAGGRVVPGLTIRRTDEFILFSQGDYGGP